MRSVSALATVLLLGAVTTLAGPILAEEMPILVLDTGGHTSQISEVIFTPDGRNLVSVGHDKVVRIWDVAEGRTVRTIRGQIGPGHEGKIYAAALCPDGKILAVGGWLAGAPKQRRAVRLHDLSDGTVLTLLKGHGHTVLSLAFSPDGRRLVSSSFDYTVRLWWLPSYGGEWRKERVFKGHGDYVFTTAFSPDGRRIASGSWDHTARLWDVTTGRLLREFPHDDKVWAVAFSAAGDLLLTGAGGGQIRRWDAWSGEAKGILGTQGRDVTGLTLSPKGDRAVTGVGSGRGSFDAQVFGVPTGKVVSRFRHSNTVPTVDFSPDGRLVAGGGGNENEITLWDPQNGSEILKLVGDGRAVWSIAFAKDGRSLAFGNSGSFENLNHRGPLERFVELRTSARGGFELGLGGEVASEDSWERGRDAVNGLRLATPSGGSDPVLRLLRGEDELQRWERDVTSGSRHLCFTFDRQGRRVASGGGSGVLTVYDVADGTGQNLVGHTSDVWAVAVSPDGKLLASGSNDQTIRLWDLDSASLLVTIFVGRDDEWVAWTPDGYYTASPNGERYIGWHVNRGVDQRADYYPVEQFRKQYYWSDVVHKTLELRDPDLALREARARLPVGSDRARSVSAPGAADRPELPPKVIFVTPRPEARVTTARLAVRVLALSTGTPLTGLTISLNGRVVNKLEGRAKGNPTEREEEITLELAPGRNELTAVATTERSRGTESVTVTYTPSRPARPARTGPKLAVLAVGVSEYSEASLKLSYADDDARDVAERFAAQEGKAFSAVATRVLTDKEVSRGSLLSGLSWLREQTPSPGDVRLLFLSGHGQVDGRGAFYFLSADHRSGTDLEQDDLSWLTLLLRLTEGDATAVLMVDACHAAAITGPSGRAAPTNFTDLLKEIHADATNLVTFAASTARQVSVERDAWRNGAFTEALLAGLAPNGADGIIGGRKNGVVSVEELGAFVRAWVRRETGGAQAPALLASPGLEILGLYELP